VRAKGEFSGVVLSEIRPAGTAKDMESIVVDGSFEKFVNRLENCG
jgi:hypothetical protein